MPKLTTAKRKKKSSERNTACCGAVEAAEAVTALAQRALQYGLCVESTLDRGRVSLVESFPSTLQTCTKPIQTHSSSPFHSCSYARTNMQVCVATRDFAPGDVIFSETSFVCASESPESCLVCAQQHEMDAPPPHCALLAQQLGCSLAALADLDEACQAVAELDGFTTLDRARCFVK
jgi:hypothetical protein